MNASLNVKMLLVILLALMMFTVGTWAAASDKPDGSVERPLRVILIPADGGTESGTRADFEPLFNAVSRATGLNFSVRVGQSYSAVIEAISSNLVDIAWFGPVAYVQARERGAAELLAVSVSNDESVYYAGIFVTKNSPIKDVSDLKGRGVSFGDINSASSFTYQAAMMLEAGINPAQDLDEIHLTGSHSNSIMALSEGLVDAACLSFESYQKAVNQGSIDAKKYRVLAKSEPIPNPPIGMSTQLSDDLKNKLRTAFHEVHSYQGISPEMIRGYGGKQVDRYNAEFSEERFTTAAHKLSQVTDELKAEILRKAGAR